jgi:anti-sigma factor RsiW
MQVKFTEYLDGRLSGREMQRVAAHLERCRQCAAEWRALEQAQSSLAGLGPVAEPEDLVLRIRVALSQERARRRRSPFHSLELAWKNTVGPFLLRTVILLVTMFAQPESARAIADEPLGMATSPRFIYLSSVVTDNQVGAVAGQVVVEAYINGAGEVYDYRITAGPTDAATRQQVETMLLWSRFEPARRFGQPVRGLAVMSFTGVLVRG